MTHPTKPLDIEARELLANAMDAEFHRSMRSKEIREGWRLEIAEKCALSAITELLTRLREVEGARDEALCRLLSAGSERPTAEDMDWAISMSASLRRKEIATEQNETEKLKALLEGAKSELVKLETVALEEVRNHGVSTNRGEYHSGYAAALRRAASLIEKLEGMG